MFNVQSQCVRQKDDNPLILRNSVCANPHPLTNEVPIAFDIEQFIYHRT